MLKRNYSSLCPAQFLAPSTVFPPSEGLVLGSGENVFSGLHPRPSEQLSRPRPHSSLQFTQL